MEYINKMFREMKGLLFKRSWCHKELTRQYKAGTLVPSEVPKHD